MSCKITYKGREYTSDKELLDTIRKDVDKVVTKNLLERKGMEFNQLQSPTAHQDIINKEIKKALSHVKEGLSKDSPDELISFLFHKLPIEKGSKLLSGSKISFLRNKEGIIKDRKFKLNPTMYENLKNNNFVEQEVTLLVHEVIHWVTESNSLASKKFKETVDNLYKKYKKEIHERLKENLLPADANTIIEAMEGYSVELLTYTLTDPMVFDALSEIEIKEENENLTQSLLSKLLEFLFDIVKTNKTLTGKLIDILETYENEVLNEEDSFEDKIYNRIKSLGFTIKEFKELPEELQRKYLGC